MTQKKSYSRYFIILQEDEKGYALASDKLPSGYAKLEIKNDKCKISYYVQNLKKESEPYRMILICGKKDVKKIIKLGELNIDEHGRSDVSYEYAVDNVANSGINVDKVIGAGIVRFINSNLVSVMSGFASNEIPEWRDYVIVEEDQQRLDKLSEVNPEAMPEKEEEPNNIFEEYEAKIEEVKDENVGINTGIEEIQTEEADNMEESDFEIDNRTEDIQLENIEPANSGEEEDEEHRHKNKKKDKDEEKCNEHEFKPIEKKCEKEKSHKDKENCEEEKSYKEDYKCQQIKEKPKSNVGVFFNNLVKDYEEIHGIACEIKRCSWYKIPVGKLEDMNSCSDYNKYTVVYYPMINYYQYLRRFGHFLMGYKLDKMNKMKYLVYGIPGTKSRRDQPYGGRTGFVTWVPIKEGDEGEGSLGYWLMFYDFRNSTIVIPVK